MHNQRPLQFGDDIIGSLGDWGEKTLAPVSIIGGTCLEKCQDNRNTFKNNDVKLTQAHASACSAIMNLASRTSGRKIGAIVGKHAQQLDLIAHFIQGIQLCEVAIVEGLYVQAATLLRQEHELISAIQELGLDRRKDGKTPHATIGLLKDMGGAYGDLSGAAHVAQSQLLHSIIELEQGDLRGPSIFPIYHRDLARQLYSLHVCYIVLMASIAGEIHKALGLDGLCKDESFLLEVAIRILLDEGLILARDVDLDQPIEKMKQR